MKRRSQTKKQKQKERKEPKERVKPFHEVSRATASQTQKDKSIDYAEAMLDEILLNRTQIENENDVILNLKKMPKSHSATMMKIIEKYYPFIKEKYIYTQGGALSEICEYINKPKRELLTDFLTKLNTIINELCLYTAIGTPMSKFRKIFNLQKKDYILIGNQAKREQEKQQAHDTRENKKNVNVITLSYAKLYSIVRDEINKGLDNKYVTDREASAMLIIEICTGLRNTEITRLFALDLLQFGLVDIREGTTYVEQIGKTLKMRERKEEAIIKPLLFNLTMEELKRCKDIIRVKSLIVQERNKHITDEEKLNRIFSNAFNTDVNKRLKEIMPISIHEPDPEVKKARQITSHTLRTIYIKIAMHLYKPSNLADSKYLKQLLGHKDDNLYSSYDGVNIVFDKKLHEHKNLKANVEELKEDAKTLKTEVKQMEQKIQELKDENPALNNNAKTVLVNGQHVHINQRQRNKTEQNMRTTIDEYRAATNGEFPTKQWLRKVALYGASITTAAAKNGLLG